MVVKVNIDDSLRVPGPSLDAVVHVHPVPGPGDAGGAGLQVVAVREEPAVALVRIPRPELASGGHRTPILTMTTSSDSSNAKESSVPV